MEIGIALAPEDDDADPRASLAALDAAFRRIAAVQATLSRFDSESDVGRFNRAPAGTCAAVGPDAQVVLAAAAALCEDSDGAFDVSLGSGRDAWRCESGRLHKRSATVRLDLGGIAKGHAVDVAVASLRAGGVGAGWVNAGGDLRTFGSLPVPLDLRDESVGGVRRFGVLEDGAFATSVGGSTETRGRHVSVAAPRCLYADALTKIVLASNDVAHPLLARHGAHAWLH